MNRSLPLAHYRVQAAHENEYADSSDRPNTTNSSPESSENSTPTSNLKKRRIGDREHVLPDLDLEQITSREPSATNQSVPTTATPLNSRRPYRDTAALPPAERYKRTRQVQEALRSARLSDQSGTSQPLLTASAIPKHMLGLVRRSGAPSSAYPKSAGRKSGGSDSVNIDTPGPESGDLKSAGLENAGLRSAAISSRSRILRHGPGMPTSAFPSSAATPRYLATRPSKASLKSRPKVSKEPEAQREDGTIEITNIDGLRTNESVLRPRNKPQDDDKQPSPRRNIETQGLQGPQGGYPRSQNLRRKQDSGPEAGNDDSSGDEDDDDENLSEDSDASSVDENVTLMNELGFSVERRDIWGKPELVEYWLRLDSGEVDEFYEWVDEQEVTQQMDVNGVKRKAIKRTRFYTNPPTELLKAAFTQLWAWAHDVQEAHLKSRAEKKVLQKALTKAKSLPLISDFMLNDPSAGLIGLQKMIQKQLVEINTLNEENEQLRLEARLAGTDNKNLGDPVLWERFLRQVKVASGFADDGPLGIEEHPRHNVEVIEKHYEEQNAALTAQLIAAQERELQTSIRIQGLTQELEISMRRHSDAERSKQALRQQLNDAKQMQKAQRKELDDLYGEVEVVAKRNEALQKVLRSGKNEALKAVQEKYDALELEYVNLKAQRDQMMRACKEAQAQLIQMSVHRNEQQGRMQMHLEKVRASRHRLLQSEPAHEHIEEAASEGTMSGINRRRAASPVYAGITSDSKSDPKANEQGPEHSGIGTDQPARTKKAKPGPVRTSVLKYRGPTQAYRSSIPQSGYRSPDLRRLLHKTKKDRANTANGISNASPTTTPNEVLDNLPPASPGIFAWKDSIRQDFRASTSAGLTPIWESMEKLGDWPVTFEEQAKVFFDITTMTRNHQTYTFRRGDVVRVYTVPLGEFWYVRIADHETEPIYVLPRNAISLCCQHGEIYNESYCVRERWDAQGLPNYMDLILPNDEIVYCAHSNNFEGKEGELGDLFRCVKSIRNSRQGWVPAVKLAPSPIKWTLPAIAARECPCIDPRPYTGTARVLQDCVGQPNSFKMKEGDEVDLAHLDDENHGMHCIKHQRTGKQGFIHATNLHIYRRPIFQPDVLFEGEALLGLTPRQVPSNLVGGYDSPVDIDVHPMGGFSQDVKNAWESNLQGHNPDHKTWDEYEIKNKIYKTWRKGPPEEAYFIEYKDNSILPRPWKDVLTRNPLGPRSGPSRARSKSLILDGQERFFKRSPHLGCQTRKTIHDGDGRDEEYMSDPCTSPKRSRLRKYIFDRNSVTVVKTDPYAGMSGRMWAPFHQDPRGKHWTAQCSRWRDGYLDFIGLDLLMQLARTRHPRGMLTGDVSDTTPASSAQTATAAMGRIVYQQDRELDLVYSLRLTGQPGSFTRTEVETSHLVEIIGLNRRKKLIKVQKVSAETLIPLTDPDIDTLSVEHLNSDGDWPRLRTALVNADEMSLSAPELLEELDGSQLVLLVSKLVDSVPVWGCMVNGGYRDVPASQLELEAFQYWQPFDAVVKEIWTIEQRRQAAVADTEPSPTAQISTLADVEYSTIPTVPVSEWDFIHRPLEDVEGLGEGYLDVPVQQWLYINPSPSSEDESVHCRICCHDEEQGLVPVTAIDERRHLPVYDFDGRCELGMQNGAFVVAVKDDIKLGQVLCVLPDGSRRWLARDPRLFNVANCSAFSLKELVDRLLLPADTFDSLIHEDFLGLGRDSINAIYSEFEPEQGSVDVRSYTDHDDATIDVVGWSNSTPAQAVTDGQGSPSLVLQPLARSPSRPATAASPVEVGETTPTTNNGRKVDTTERPSINPGFTNNDSHISASQDIRDAVPITAPISITSNAPPADISDEPHDAQRIDKGASSLLEDGKPNGKTADGGVSQPSDASAASSPNLVVPFKDFEEAKEAEQTQSNTLLRHTESVMTKDASTQTERRHPPRLTFVSTNRPSKIQFARDPRSSGRVDKSPLTYSRTSSRTPRSGKLTPASAYNQRSSIPPEYLQALLKDVERSQIVATFQDILRQQPNFSVAEMQEIMRWFRVAVASEIEKQRIDRCRASASSSLMYDNGMSEIGILVNIEDEGDVSTDGGLDLMNDVHVWFDFGDENIPAAEHNFASMSSLHIWFDVEAEKMAVVGEKFTIMDDMHVWFDLMGATTDYESQSEEADTDCDAVRLQGHSTTADTQRPVSMTDATSVPPAAPASGSHSTDVNLPQTQALQLWSPPPAYTKSQNMPQQRPQPELGMDILSVISETTPSQFARRIHQAYSVSPISPDFSRPILSFTNCPSLAIAPVSPVSQSEPRPPSPQEQTLFGRLIATVILHIHYTLYLFQQLFAHPIVIAQDLLSYLTTTVQRYIKHNRLLTSIRLWHLLYYIVLAWLLVSIHIERWKWLDYNGVAATGGYARGVQLVRERRNAASGGGWEWVVWEVLKRGVS